MELAEGKLLAHCGGRGQSGGWGGVPSSKGSIRGRKRHRRPCAAPRCPPADGAGGLINFCPGKDVAFGVSDGGQLQERYREKENEPAWADASHMYPGLCLEAVTLVVASRRTAWSVSARRRGLELHPGQNEDVALVALAAGDLSTIHSWRLIRLDVTRRSTGTPTAVYSMTQWHQLRSRPRGCQRSLSRRPRRSRGPQQQARTGNRGVAIHTT